MVAHSVSIDQTALWRALAHPKRQQIIQLLTQQSLTTSELCAHFDVSRFAVMKHLKVLEETGLIQAERTGRQRWNRLNQKLWQQIQREKMDIVPTDESGPLQLTADLPAPPAAGYHAWLTQIDSWWPHRQDAASAIVLESTLNGRFYEAFPNNKGGILLATVTALRENEWLGLHGALSWPPTAVVHTVRLTFTGSASEQETQLTIHHQGSRPLNQPEWRRWWQIVLDSLQQYLSVKPDNLQTMDDGR